MKKSTDASPPCLRIPLPPHLTHDDIEFVHVCPSHLTGRLSDEVVVALGMALFDVTESHHSVSSTGNALWKVIGRLESIQRNEP